MVGRLGELGMLGELDEVLGMLGDDGELGELDDGLGILGEEGELGELEALGILGMLDDDEELEVVSQPASTSRETHRASCGNCLFFVQPFILFIGLFILLFTSLF